MYKNFVFRSELKPSAKASALYLLDCCQDLRDQAQNFLNCKQISDYILSSKKILIVMSLYSNRAITKGLDVLIACFLPYSASLNT